MTEKDLKNALAERILILDGAMGTEIQKYHFSEDDFRGVMFANHNDKLAGCNDVLSLTQPEAIAAIHSRYLDAGADIIETNTFNANAVSLADYGLQKFVKTSIALQHDWRWQKWQSGEKRGDNAGLPVVLVRLTKPCRCRLTLMTLPLATSTSTFW